MNQSQILAALARMEAREQEARRRTGEPCRCPEHVLDCQCGAYEATGRGH